MQASSANKISCSNVHIIFDKYIYAFGVEPPLLKALLLATKAAAREEEAIWANSTRQTENPFRVNLSNPTSGITSAGAGGMDRCPDSFQPKAELCVVSQAMRADACFPST